MNIRPTHPYPTIDLIAVTDINDLMLWRAEVIANVFEQPASQTLLDANRRYYLTHIADGTHYAVKALYDGEESGCGSVCFSDELPSPDNPDGRCAYLMNIYVREPYRNNGIAHKIIDRLIAVSKRHKAAKIYLETTDQGKPVYQSSGFTAMPDMMKYYDTET